MRRMGVVAAVLLLALSAGCAGDDDDNNNVSRPGGDLGDGGTASGEWQKQTQAEFGQPVTYQWRFGWEVNDTVTSGTTVIKVDAPRPVGEGEKGLQADIVVRASGGDGFRISHAEFALIGPDGTKYLDASTGTLRDITLSPGQRTEGTVVFESPEELSSASVEYNPFESEGHPAVIVWR